MDKNTIEIVLVEDNPADVELALHALQKHNLANHVQVLRDGEEALEFFFCTGAYAGRENDGCPTPKVVLLDLKLPKFDGIDVLRALKGDARTHNIPVVMLTTSQQERDIVESYNLGVNSYIVKPIDFEQFIKAVERLGFYWVLLNQRPESG